MNGATVTEPTRRGWFRFGLRSLFIVVTLACCYLAWERSAVLHRQAVLKELRSNPNYQITSAEQWSRRSIITNPAERMATVSPVRRWLGDQAIQEITYQPHLDSAAHEVARVRLAFPEATFHKEERLFEPCHPGCFPAGTMVQTLAGPRRIETIRVGDLITTIDPDGDATATQVQTIFVTDNQLWQIDTDDGLLITTKTQPLYVGAGENAQVGDLQAGDTIFRWQNGVAHPTTVRAVSSTDRVAKVYNLILGNSEVFVAGEFLARSKPPADDPLP
jgi:hypothetical protein